MFCKIAVVSDSNLAYFPDGLNGDRNYLDYPHFQKTELLPEPLLYCHHCLDTNDYTTSCVPCEICLLTSAAQSELYQWYKAPSTEQVALLGM